MRKVLSGIARSEGGIREALGRVIHIPNNRSSIDIEMYKTNEIELDFTIIRQPR